MSTAARKGTVTSRPGMYSSTSTPAGYLISSAATFSRACSIVSATESWVIPFEEPSEFGFTITGKCRSSILSAASFSTYCHAGVRMPCFWRMSLVSCLSSVTASA